MTRSAEPEREIVRRVLPFGPPAILLALAAGRVASGWDAGFSAAIGVAVVYVNSLIHGISLTWASRISPTALYGVGMGGFVVRLGAILALLFALNRVSFFSPLAFLLAVVPATAVLLIYEMKLLAGGIGQDLSLNPAGERRS
jgi:ATP synthase protein I